MPAEQREPHTARARFSRTPPPVHEMHLIGDPEGASELAKLEQGAGRCSQSRCSLFLANSLIYHCYCLVLLVQWVACERRARARFSRFHYFTGGSEPINEVSWKLAIITYKRNRRVTTKINQNGGGAFVRVKNRRLSFTLFSYLFPRFAQNPLCICPAVLHFALFRARARLVVFFFPTAWSVHQRARRVSLGKSLLCSSSEYCIFRSSARDINLWFEFDFVQLAKCNLVKFVRQSWYNAPRNFP